MLGIGKGVYVVEVKAPNPTIPFDCIIASLYTFPKKLNGKPIGIGLVIQSSQGAGKAFVGEAKTKGVQGSVKISKSLLL